MSKIILIFMLFAFLLSFFLLEECTCSSEYVGEMIVYGISPIGRSEYKDLGRVILDGKAADVVSFKTQAFGFSDTEKIYFSPGSLSPLKVERDVTTWLGKEYLEEKYDPKSFTLSISKFKGNKKVKEYVFKENAPIYNVILLFFYLRSIPEIDIGWTFEARIPEKFRVELDSIEEVEVPAGKFLAYHFRSMPDKFELWISKEHPHTPVKIKGKGGFGYTLWMEEHSLGKVMRPDN